MTTLTFGKYEGHNLSDLIKIDRDYLIWCADNLSNRQWVRKIERVLRKNPEFNPVQQLRDDLEAVGASSLQTRQLIKMHTDCRLDFDRNVTFKNRQAVKAAFDKYEDYIKREDDIDPDAWMKPAGHDKEW